MGGYGLGLLLGYVMGMGIGSTIGTKRKPWSELDDRRKKVRFGVFAAINLLALAVAIVFLIRLES